MFTNLTFRRKSGKPVFIQRGREPSITLWISYTKNSELTLSICGGQDYREIHFRDGEEVPIVEDFRLIVEIMSPHQTRWICKADRSWNILQSELMLKQGAA